MMDYREYFLCRVHKPEVIEPGFKCIPNIEPKTCETCGKAAEVVVFPKPLTYPKLSA